MRKYDLNIRTGKIGADGLAETAGWVKCYLADPVTHEYIGATMENVMKDISLSAGAYPDEPALPENENQAVRRTADGSAWEIVDDHRGLTAYDTQTRQSVTVDFIGALPETLTLLKPANEFDKWNGQRWVTDKTAMKKALIKLAVQQKTELLQETENYITQLERKVRLEMASEEEKAKLKEWEIYSVLLSQIDPENPVWPEQPER